MLARISVLAVPLVFSVGIAHAVTLSTPLLQGGSGLSCAITNVGTNEARLDSAEMYDISGAVVALDGDSCGDTLAPKATCALIDSADVPLAFCQVQGSGKLRLSIIGFDNGVTAALAGTSK
jgi:hypothetical protein